MGESVGGGGECRVGGGVGGRSKGGGLQRCDRPSSDMTSSLYPYKDRLYHRH